MKRILLMGIALLSFMTSNAQVNELYVIGNAIPDAGWESVEKAVKMSKQAENTFVFEGFINNGEFKFIGTNTDWKPCYVSETEGVDIESGKTYPIVFSADYPTNDYKFNCDAPDWYKITVSTDEQNPAMKVEKGGWPEALYLVGGATEGGWLLDNAVPLAKDQDKPYVFTCTTELKVRDGNEENNTFKILGQNTDWGPASLHPATANQPINEAETFTVNGDDTKWIVPEDKQGEYTITVNLYEGTIKAELKESGDGTTGISGIGKEATANGKIFSITGVYTGKSLDNLPKGIYIVDGKKVVVK